jgi:hypothetical protein
MVIKLNTPEIMWNLCAISNMLPIYYIKLCDLYLSNLKCLHMCSVMWCLSCSLYVMYCPLYFHVFIHLHLSSHLGMLDAPCEGAEPEDGVGGSIPKMEVPWSACLKWRCHQDSASLLNLLVSDSRQAPEHYKS